MRPTVRRRILGYLGRQPDSSAAQIGRNLDLSPATVRHHLAILKSDGRISRAGAYRRLGRGRPSVTFRISDRLAGDNLAAIAASLLDAWPSKSGSSAAQPVVTILARSIQRQVNVTERGAPISKRIASLVDGLNAAHYQARWEAGAEGPRILLGHCPYAAIIQDHPMLCKMDTQVISQLTGRKADQTAKIDFRTGSVGQCIFVIR